MSYAARCTASRASKHDLATLAVNAAIEFERTIAGLTPDVGRISRLASELRAKAEPLPGGVPFRLIEPGYLAPLGNIVRRSDRSAKTVEAVQAQIIEIANELDRFASDATNQGSAEQLRDVCLALHNELLQELMAEEAPAHDWQREFRSVEAGVSAT